MSDQKARALEFRRLAREADRRGDVDAASRLRLAEARAWSEEAQRLSRSSRRLAWLALVLAGVSFVWSIASAVL